MPAIARADHGDRDDHQGGQAHRLELGEAGEQRARHRHADRDAGDDDRPAAGGGGDPQCRVRAPAGLPLLALPAQVEQAVVDADGHADQQHHGVGGVAHRLQMADQAHQAHRRHDRGHRQTDRQQRRHQCAEGDQQDAEGHRHGGVLGPLEVLAEGVGVLLVHAGAADLRDPQRAVRLLHPGHRVQDRLDPVGGGLRVAPHVELDQRAAAVLRDGSGGVRRGDAGGPAGAADRLDDVRDGGPEPGVRGLDRRVLGLDQDRLARRLPDPRVVDDPRRGVGLALELVALVDVDPPGRRAESHGQDDEQHPYADGGPAVPGAPAAGPGGQAPHPRLSVSHDGIHDRIAPSCAVAAPAATDSSRLPLFDSKVWGGQDRLLVLAGEVRRPALVAREDVGPLHLSTHLGGDDQGCPFRRRGSAL
jgi:hypothetical protein